MRRVARGGRKPQFYWVCALGTSIEILARQLKTRDWNPERQFDMQRAQLAFGRKQYPRNIEHEQIPR
jgi:hypothetical protein